MAQVSFMDGIMSIRGKLGDTIFTLGQVEFEEHNVFLPVKMLNNARRDIVQALYDAKIASQSRREIAEEAIPGVNYVVLSGPSHAEEVGKLMPTINKKMGEYQKMINRGAIYA